MIPNIKASVTVMAIAALMFLFCLKNGIGLFIAYLIRSPLTSLKGLPAVWIGGTQVMQYAKTSSFFSSRTALPASRASSVFMFLLAEDKCWISTRSKATTALFGRNLLLLFIG